MTRDARIDLRLTAGDKAAIEAAAAEAGLSITAYVVACALDARPTIARVESAVDELAHRASLGDADDDPGATALWAAVGVVRTALRG